jgi:RNA polymerase sigma factor (sigma-70 family)
MRLPFGKANSDTIAADAFAEAYLKGYRVTVRFLRSKGASMDAAEEVAQAAWARGWEAREQLQIEDRILPWINSIAYHRFCNDQRRLVRHSQLFETSDRRIPPPANALDAGAILSLCSPMEQTLLTKRYFEGLEMKEIAAALGLTEMAVRVRIHRCQSALRVRVLRGSRKAKAAYSQLRRGPIPISSDGMEPCAA